MDLPLSPKSPKRQLTLGPGAPIYDWEVERATLLKHSKESQEKAERLERVREEEQAQFEKNTLSLLREVKLKEAYLEKKLKDVENRLMEQIFGLEQKLEDSQREHVEQIKSLKTAHAQTLTKEEKKYERRLLGLQERLEAKDQDRIEQSRTREEKDGQIEALKIKLAEVGGERATESQKVAGQAKRIETLEKQVGHYKKRFDQASVGYHAQIQGLTEKLISEAKQSEMVHQARIQNLQAEHHELYRELRESHQTEKEVWSIEKEAAVDQMRHRLTLTMEEAVEKLDKAWKEKYDDLTASMSKDASVIQSRWEKKREESESYYSAKLDRLMGETEVVKDRLGKEIERRKCGERAWAECLEQKATLQTKLDASQAEARQRRRTEHELHQVNRPSTAKG
ncbi:hypothetical protein BY458DRAFT_518484 [Sporodiniella umbellata]|nr:hypothetical protein BY458DRAFT_518484 [Sporodiniella umbellata]